MPSQRKEKLKKDIVTSSVLPLEKSTGFLEGFGFGLLFLFQSLRPPHTSRGTSSSEFISTGVIGTVSTCCPHRDIRNLSNDPPGSSSPSGGCQFKCLPRPRRGPDQHQLGGDCGDQQSPSWRGSCFPIQWLPQGYTARLVLPELQVSPETPKF